LDTFCDLQNKLEGSSLAESFAKFQDVVKQVVSRHVLRHYDLTVTIFRVVDEMQGVSAFAFSDLLQQLDFLWRLIALTVYLCKVLLVNEFECNFVVSCLILRQNHLAKTAFAERLERHVLG